MVDRRWPVPIALVAASAMLLGILHIAPSATGNANVTPITALAPRALWGRQSFVPDWRQGNAIDLRATQYFLEHSLGRLDTHVPPVASTNTDEQAVASSAPYVIFATDYWQALDVGFQPVSANSRLNELKLFAARGESEPIALGVRISESDGQVQITWNDFTNAVGRIAREDASLHVMLSYNARAEQGKRPSAIVHQPMVLLTPANGQWQVKRNETVVFVLDIHVPPDTPAGTYTSTVTVQIDDRLAQSVPLSLEVLPFALKTNEFHAGAFGTTFARWTGGFSGYYPEMMEMDSRYGFNLAGAFFNKGNEIPFRTDAAGRMEVDVAHPKFAHLNATLHRLKSYGMGDIAFWNWGATGNVSQFNNVLAHAGVSSPINTPAGQLGFAQLLRAIKDVESSHAWPELVVNPFDEALKDQDATRALIESTAAVRAISPRTRLYMTEWRPQYTRHYQSSGRHLAGQNRPRERAYRRLLRANEEPRLNFSVIGSNTLDSAGRRLQDRLGGEYWHYTGATKLAAETRFAFGFKPWIQRSEAVLLWANYKGNLSGEGWTLHYVLRREPTTRANRSPRGPVVPSVRALAVREGIDDRKYIETLRYHAWRLGAHDELRYLLQLSDTARALMLNYAEIGGLDNVEGRVADGQRLQALRVEIKDRIIALLAGEARLKTAAQ